MTRTATRKTQPRPKKPRATSEIMLALQELEEMLRTGKSPHEMFTVRTVEIPDPGTYTARQVRALRDRTGTSQAVFAHLLGVSTVLVKSWEQGTRTPSPLARRLLDTIRADPKRWLASVRVTTKVA